MSQSSKQAQPREFNVNEYVWVKVNERGFRVLADADAELNATMRKVRGPQFDQVSRIRGEQERNDGWSRWQLWTLMHTFGPHVSMGFDPPFETTIRIGQLAPPETPQEDAPPVTFTENEIKDVLTALYQDGHVDLVLADRVAALMQSPSPMHPRHPYDVEGSEYLPDTCSHAERSLICRECALFGIRRLTAPSLLAAPEGKLRVLIAKWREKADAAMRIAREAERDHDSSGNVFAFHKEARVRREQADELEAALAPLAEPPA